MTTTIDTYPVRFDVDYPEEPRNRLMVFFRLLVVIPILIVLVLLSGGLAGGGSEWDSVSDETRTEAQTDWGGSGAAVAGGVVVIPTVLMLLFRRKYPRWWFDWNLEISRFGARVGSFMGLLRDEYPSTDEEQAVHLDIDYPDAGRLNRWLPLVKWLLAVPHYIVLLFLFVGVFFVTVFAWFAVLLTGRYPRGLFDFSVGVSRWFYRVEGYALMLVTDRYPPFSTR